MRKLIRFFGLVLVASGAVLVTALCFSFLQHEFFAKGSPGRSHAHIAVLDISGVILNSHSVIRELEEILEDHDAKAIVVRVNSPGGLVAPSQEMYEALKRADEKIPVIVSMGSVAASGGYYAALAGRKVYASPGTLTASIGVIMEFVNTEKLYQWAKIERQSMKAGKFKDIGNPARAMTQQEKELIQTMLTDIHGQFRKTVQERRKLTPQQVEETCDGRVMTGQQAFQARLVDTLGGFEDAVREAKKIAKLPENAEVEFPTQHKGLLKELLLGDAESSFERFFETLSENSLIQASLSPGWKMMYLSPLR